MSRDLFLGSLNLFAAPLNLLWATAQDATSPRFSLHWFFAGFCLAMGVRLLLNAWEKYECSAPH